MPSLTRSQVRRSVAFSSKAEKDGVIIPLDLNHVQPLLVRDTKHRFSLSEKLDSDDNEQDSWDKDLSTNLTSIIDNSFDRIQVPPRMKSSSNLVAIMFLIPSVTPIVKKETNMSCEMFMSPSELSKDKDVYFSGARKHLPANRVTKRSLHNLECTFDAIPAKQARLIQLPPTPVGFNESPPLVTELFAASASVNVSEPPVALGSLPVTSCTSPRKSADPIGPVMGPSHISMSPSADESPSVVDPRNNCLKSPAVMEGFGEPWKITHSEPWGSKRPSMVELDADAAAPVIVSVVHDGDNMKLTNIPVPQSTTNENSVMFMQAGALVQKSPTTLSKTVIPDSTPKSNSNGRGPAPLTVITEEEGISTDNDDYVTPPCEVPSYVLLSPAPLKQTTARVLPYFPEDSVPYLPEEYPHLTEAEIQGFMRNSLRTTSGRDKPLTNPPTLQPRVYSSHGQGYDCLHGINPPPLRQLRRSPSTTSLEKVRLPQMKHPKDCAPLRYLFGSPKPLATTCGGWPGSVMMAVSSSNSSILTPTPIKLQGAATEAFDNPLMLTNVFNKHGASELLSRLQDDSEMLDELLIDMIELGPVDPDTFYNAPPSLVRTSSCQSNNCIENEEQCTTRRCVSERKVTPHNYDLMGVSDDDFWCLENIMHDMA